MRRGVTGNQTRKLLNDLRTRIPGVTLRTTFIVGYPSETEKEFEELCEFVRETKFDRIGTFTYSVEENTSSFILGDPVSKNVKAKRKDILMEIQKKLKVLVEALEGDFYIGRSYRDAPEVDGEVLINRRDNKFNIGDFYDVDVYDYNEYDLFAKVLKN
jgi:ribosomal protein S12 methylthiotransferase